MDVLPQHPYIAWGKLLWWQSSEQSLWRPFLKKGMFWDISLGLLKLGTGSWTAQSEGQRGEVPGDLLMHIGLVKFLHCS